MKNMGKIAVFVLLLTLALPSMGCLPSWLSSRQDAQLGLGIPRYGVVLDAGSSGTRVRIYQFIRDLSPLHFSNMAEIANKKVKPALSTFVGDEEKVASYITELIDFAKEKVPEDQHSSTDILVMATAGMRSIRPRHRADDVMAAVRLTLSNPSLNPFFYKYPSQVQILSGEEEAAYAWVAVNYLRGVFHRPEGGASWLRGGATDMSDTYGVLEIGGASMQIAFVPEQQPLAGEFPVTLGGRKFSLYAHSYLGFGINALVEKMTDDFKTVPNANVSSGVTRKENPCYLNDDTQSLTFESGESFTYVGTGNSEQCQSGIAKYLNYADEKEAEQYCNPSPCAILNTYQPNIPQGMTFYAKGGFEYVVGHFELAKSDGTFNATDLQKASSDFCPLPYQEAIKKFPKTPAKYLSNRCLLGEYVGLLLSDQGFGRFGPDLKATDKIDDVKAEWTLGALVVNQYERLSGITAARRLR